MNDLTWIELIYWVSTIIGGTLFILRTIMMLIGGGLEDTDFDGGDIDTDFDAGVDADIDTGVDVDTHSSSDVSFKLLSMQGLTAFFMMFGLVGLALFKSNLHVLITLFGATIAGLISVWVLSWLFAKMKLLQSDGTINIKNAIGEKGSVYLTIPAKSSGQVQVTVQGALKIFDAITEDGKKLSTGEQVKVIGVANNKTLIVEKNRKYNKA